MTCSDDDRRFSSVNTCQYIYCRSYPTDAHVGCPVCGYPVDRALLTDYDFICERVRTLALGTIVDMHQIIRNADGAFAMQLRIMEDIGIRKALLQSVSDDFTAICGNRQLQRLVKGNEGKFWLSHYVDPRAQHAIETLRRCAERGVTVIKIVPCIGFAADDPVFDPFWRTMEELGLVAMVHTGFITARHKHLERQIGGFLNSRYGHPFYFDQPARKFSTLQFILCHLGGVSWYREAAQMVTEHDNVWADISGFGLLAFRSVLAERVPINFDKIFWGNDSSPNAYPFNLALAAAALRQFGLRSLERKIFHDNGMMFAESYLREQYVAGAAQ